MSYKGVSSIFVISRYWVNVKALASNKYRKFIFFTIDWIDEMLTDVTVY